MNFTKIYNKLCCIMQWNIGFYKADIKDIIRNKKSGLSFTWLSVKNSNASIADPFIFKGTNGGLNMLYEDFSMTDPKKYGKILLASLSNNFEVIQTKEVLDAKSHSSYPFIFIENGTTYIIPETSQRNEVSLYEYDFASESLINKKILIQNLPLLDSTIHKYNGKYWLFATLGSNGYDHSHLYIYYADKLSGGYTPHAGNPVKINLDGARPAGNIIEVDGEMYRPAQNCKQHYGESIAINKIIKLTETDFSEEFYLKITPDKNSAFNAGVHTINAIDDIIVIDGIKMLFKPFTKWILFLRKKIKN